ncbi:hypothetical protein DL771_008736 [Monosporascus sp. 5C6A]|nr:hypothetical protein DL771_008736 [Monosporascus sp. 5C6A]
MVPIDTLGAFGTYESSGGLALQNEFLNPGKDRSKALREKAGNLMPEKRLLLGILATAVFREDDHKDHFQESQNFRGLSRVPANNFVQTVYTNGTAIAINTAVPFMNEALIRAQGISVLTGSPIVAIPQYFDDCLWRLGGFTAVALKLVERSSSPKEILHSVEMMFLCVKKSWRNSEAMERDNGYNILGMLLRAKLDYDFSTTETSSTRLVCTDEERDQLSFQLLSLILDFVGYKHADPLESFIINPLAYCILLIDSDTWRKSAPVTQMLYYRQLVTFVVLSKYQQFNNRRLIRMRIIKRLLDVLKAETLSEDILPYFMESFETLVKRNYTSEVCRSVALFITYAFQISSKMPLADGERVASHARVLQTVSRFLADLHSRSSNFKDFAFNSEYVRLLLSALFPFIVSTDPVSSETELNSRDSALTSEDSDVITRSISGPTSATSIIGTASVVDGTLPPESPQPRETPLRKTSSFILSAPRFSRSPGPARINHVMSPKENVTTQKISNAVLEGLLELAVNILVDQVMVQKGFPGFELFLKIPPGSQEDQAYFESYILHNTVSQLGKIVQLNEKALCDTRSLANIARVTLHMVEAIFEGRFLSGADPLLDFSGALLEYLQRPDVSSIKSVRLCSQSVSSIRSSFLKVILLWLSGIDDPQTPDSYAISIMDKILCWQKVVLGCISTKDEFTKLLWYQLYTKLIDPRDSIRLAAANIWRIMLVQKPRESSALLRQCMMPDQHQLTNGFQKLTELDNETFVGWVDQNRPSLDATFFGAISGTWEEFVNTENQRIVDAAKSRLVRRKERLRQWHSDDFERENILRTHEMANKAWMKSIYGSEHLKLQRLMQDRQDDMVLWTSTFAKMDRDLRRPGAIFAEPFQMKWKLDRTEGWNRMRLRLLPDYSVHNQEYQPQRRAIEQVFSTTLKPDTAVTTISSTQATSTIPTPSFLPNDAPNMEGGNDASDLSVQKDVDAKVSDRGVSAEDDFELVDDPNKPNEGEDTFEDINRKVMRRLEKGDSVQHIYNISRIIGLEAYEGILIFGKDSLYLIDNVLQTPTGDIINVWQAPMEERDPCSQIMGGPITAGKQQHTSRSEQKSRSWRWYDVISISKRRFFCRDVAIEVFFTGGRNHLLTAINPTLRDEIYAKFMIKAPHTNGLNPPTNPEDAWRLESWKGFEETPQTFGSRFGSIFNSSSWNPTRKWQRCEISNFHYLMLVNTMAGRTFNDITQYPVFPWVLADYTSDEINLDDPATFRDLSKPMGAQTFNRQADFIARYKAMAEIGESPFYYDTHYSSAMIVASYLIRLPPFLQSYLLLQGNTFDHSDRLFSSIKGAWTSASRDNGSDVRELIPEFFYLPDFLTNINGYNFGVGQDIEGPIDNVVLPPWAKGDPKIFIAKHREALESPYVSQNLHHWIDLVFGYKQRGDAAIENLNVFHNLSYPGGGNLDNITDPTERAIITGIVHKFGQTPHQVFSKPHPPRERAQSMVRRLDTCVYELTRPLYPLFESHERVASLIYSPKLNRVLSSSPFRLNYPPHYDKYLEWAYADNSVRFYFSENRKLAGLFENLHVGQLSCVIFADSNTLITAGEDCVISVYTVQSALDEPVQLLFRSSLFAHKTPVTSIAVSKSLSIFVSISADGLAFLWDLNRLEFVRKLPFSRPVECSRMNDVSGEIMLCSGPNVVLYTLNGDLILDQNVCAEHDDYVHSCAFYEGAGSEWLENCLIFTGHKRGRVNVWRKCVRNGSWVLEFLRRLDHVDSKAGNDANTETPITCITPTPQMVYTGDGDGRVPGV